jgi:hypothetical protein
LETYLCGRDAKLGDKFVDPWGTTMRVWPDGGMSTGGCTRLGGGTGCADAAPPIAMLQNNAHSAAAKRGGAKRGCEYRRFTSISRLDVALAYLRISRFVHTHRV